MSVRFDDIGNRLKAFRMGSGLSADQVAQSIGISRAALYRYENGEVAKIDTLDRLAKLLNVSVPSLLGVGVEYISSAVAFFERLRQIEETAEHIIVLFGPVSYLLTSHRYDDALEVVLSEAIPDDLEDRERALADVVDIMAINRNRKAHFRDRQPSIACLISGLELERFLANGLVGRPDLDSKTVENRRNLAIEEIERIAKLMEEEPIGIQIGIVSDALPQTSFQISRQPDRPLLAFSPYRMGERPNVRIGVGMITAAPEALSLYEETAETLWRRAVKGPEAAKFARAALAKYSH
jgi:transcriptional regulator with XRE-family HTH domain